MFVIAHAELAPFSTGHPCLSLGLKDILKHRLMSDNYQRIEVIPHQLVIAIGAYARSFK